MKSLPKILLAAALLSGAGYTYALPQPVAKIAFSDIVDRHLSGFEAVDVGGSFDVRITQGSTESVRVEAPADMMSHIITEVSNGVLKIYNKHENWNWGNLWGGHKKILVYVTIKNVNAVTVSGSGDVSFRDGLKANSLKIRVSGSGDVNGMVEVKTIECNISGSGDMKLAGRAESSAVSVSGSGDYSARDLATATTSVRVSGSGDAEVNASERLDAAVHGSGDVHYTGGVKNVSSSKTGSGDISRM